MQIGVIGLGKMGRDIFNHFFQYDDYSFVLIGKDTAEIDNATSGIEKQLKKSLKRGYMTEAEFEKKQQSYKASTDVADLKDCDLVIEAVFENRELKRDIFKRVGAVVKPECILASNTSSIPLNVVFEECSIKERCLGIHFFYPVKINRTVEINKTRYTDKKYADIIKNLLKKVDKGPLELKEEANMILSKMLLNVISQNYKIYEDNYLTMAEIDKVTKGNLFTFGFFEIIDSTGINIVLETRENFISERYEKLYNPFYYKGKELVAQGYTGGTGNKGFIAYEEEHPVETKKVEAAELEAYKEEMVLSIQSIIINEMAYMINHQDVDKDEINEAVKEALGLFEDPISILKRVGTEKITKCLLDSCEKYNNDVYKPEDLSVFDN